MKGVLSLIFLSTLLTFALGDALNQVNPNFTYPEKTVVDKVAINLPYSGELNTGYITVNNDTQSKIFYALYPAGGVTQNTTINNSAPLILWLQGGPGCSDGTGAYMEIGPIWINLINNVLTPLQQPITWNDDYNILFVDNPVGVGYSVSGGERPNNAMDVVKYLQVFLIRFFQLYPNLFQNDFFIFGESFGGHYIPALASLIIQNNTNNQINLKGIGVGDGWTDPYVQLGSFSEYPFAVSILDEYSRDYIYGLELKARQAADAGDFWSTAHHFDDITNFIMAIDMNISYYNFQQYNPPNPWYPNWLNLNQTKVAFGVDPSVTFQDCVNQTYFDFYPDIGQSYAGNYSFLLTQTIIPDLKIMLYSGQNDIICNSVGTLNYLKNLNWTGIDNFMTAKKQVLTAANGTIIGNYKHYDQFTFVTIYDAGHMVPFDQPNSARTMLEFFMSNQFSGAESKKKAIEA